MYNKLIFLTIQHSTIFELPPALAGEKRINVTLALAKMDAILAKALTNNPILFLQLKLEAINVLKIEKHLIVTILLATMFF